MEEDLFLQDTNWTTIAPYAHKRQDALKAIVILTLFIVTLLVSTIPFALKRAALQSEPANRRKYFVLIFSLLSCFGGGVFLATCLLDLLPDALSDVETGKKMAGFTFDFPAVEFLVGVGFFIVLSMEQILVYARERRWIGGDDLERLISHDGASPDGHTHNVMADSVVERRPSGGDTLAVPPSSDTIPAEDDPHFTPEAHSTVRAVLLVVALSMHAIFEGLSLGMVPDIKMLLEIFAALSIHKSLIGFSLGLRLVQSRLKGFTVLLCCTVFASMALIGGFLGMVVIDAVKVHSTAKLVSGSLQGIACGTFLYVTCFEILPHELNTPGYRPGKLCAVFLGFAVITVFIAVMPG